jgi:hypothetical protein
MNAKRKIEIYSAGCPVCQETIKMVQNMACTDCEVSILDMNDPAVANRAKGLGVRSVPSVAIDGKLADCCAGRGPDEATLKAGTLLVALCCFTPILVIALGAFGLSTVTPYLDYVLLPALLVMIMVVIISYLKWKKANIKI